MLKRMQMPLGKIGMDYSCQLGDMGIGFGGEPLYTMSQKHRFIRGNHDNPSKCSQHPNFLGDFGHNEQSGIFFVSGGFSVDWEWRTPHINWWKNEELTENQIKEVLILYKEVKPKIIISHECPSEVKEYVLTNPMKGVVTSRTELLLQNMLDIHRPDYWIFGHHHIKLEKTIKSTKFVALDELINGKIINCYYEIPEIKWDDENEK